MLQQYQEKAQTKAFTKYFAFFAFSQKQLKEQININFKYANMGSGLICPSIFADKLYKKLESINKKAVARVKETKTDKEIIWYELGNHEAQITCDITDTFEAVKQYGITEKEVLKVYNEYFTYCCDNDLF